jgi:hypothetical protein
MKGWASIPAFGTEYTAHLGTHWEKEKAAAGQDTFYHPDDTKYIGGQMRWEGPAVVSKLQSIGLLANSPRQNRTSSASRSISIQVSDVRQMSQGMCEEWSFCVFVLMHFFFRLVLLVVQYY